MSKNVPSHHVPPHAAGIGWYGMAAILVAFVAVSFDYIGVHEWTYQVLNLSGGLALAYSSLSKKAYPAATLNLVFAVVAAVAMLRQL